jgi:hypothetical protein
MVNHPANMFKTEGYRAVLSKANRDIVPQVHHHGFEHQGIFDHKASHEALVNER